MSLPSEPNLRYRDLVVEAWRIAVSAPVATAVTATIVAAVCGFILTTTGQTVQAEQKVLGRIDEAGTRLVSAFDDRGTASISPQAVERISRLSSVQWVIGLGYAADGKNSALGDGGTPVAVRYVWGILPPEVTVIGRQPRPGEALVGPQAQSTLGLDLPVGSIDIGDTQLPIVGGFIPGDALGSLNNIAIAIPISAQTNGLELRSVHVMAKIPRDVESLTTAVAALLGAQDATSVRFETSATLADVRAAVQGELGRYGRRLMVVALSVGLLLVAMVVYGSVTLRRQDFGRRRALGATRSTIILLVATQNILTALVGILVGATVGSFIVRYLAGGLPDTRFLAAVAVLALLIVIAAALPPAALAAYRDPVRVLRVP